ncbi:MAG: sulfite dehydrogenase [Pseudomonadota bacterium]
MDENASAANGLLNRRGLLTLGSAAGASALLTPVLGHASSVAQARGDEPWRSGSGTPPSAYGAEPAIAALKRERVSGHPFGPAAGSSSTPLQLLNGTLTPNGLHFERHHSGIPAIDAERHRLTVHGLVQRPLRFSLDALHRYPHSTRLLFLECSGNSYQNMAPEPPDLTAGELHGLVSCAEWTGVPLATLLDEAGVDPAARWIVAEGADASGTNRSVPLSIARDDAMIALYQNGEPLRAAQGYPMRLLVPGCEGNISIKWLRSLKLTEAPAQTREETSKYTDLKPDGTARQFSLRMEVKSVITAPSGTMTLPAPGVYEISGLAWSGAGSIRSVEVSADGGKTWAEAALQSEPGPLRPVRFRIPWRWRGQRAVLQSRAIDSAGHVQPNREQAFAGQAQQAFYHFNAIQSWGVDEAGRVTNVYA